jgi:hypothetical protein
MIEIHLSTIQYADFLERTLPLLWEDMPLNVLKEQVNFSHQVHNWLNNHLESRFWTDGSVVGI